MRALAVQDYTVHRCELGQAPADGPVLRILDVVYMGGLDVVDAWCRSPALARHFSALEASSVHRDNFDRRALHESRFDVVLAKPELISSASQIGNRGVVYELVASYPGYGSQLVSMRDMPELTEDWMSGRTLGLLDDPNSVSAYQVPMATLREAGLLDAPDIVYFRSYREMYAALFQGEVDVIASILSEEGPDSELQLPPGLPLAENIPGPGWFAHPSLVASDGYCAVLDALAQFAASTGVDYFRDPQIVRPCNG